MAESHFQRVTRRGLEGFIKDAVKANDINLVNEKLDIYPTGKKRTGISLERAHEVARHVIRRANQPTEPQPVITEDMLESEL